MQDFEDWLVNRGDGDPVEHVMEPPGWLLRVPAVWHAYAPARTATGQLPEPYAGWAADGKVLVFPYLNRQAFWPLERRCGGPGWAPVVGIEPLAAAAEVLRSDQVSGFIEAVLIDWNYEYEEEPTLNIALELPADLAHRFGFLTAEEQQRAMARARAATLERMDAIIDTFKDEELDEHDLRQLQQARGNTRRFRSLATRYSKRVGSRFRVARASWRWPGRSVAHELLAGSPPDLVQALATWAHRGGLLFLEQSMQEAWQRAFDQYGRRV